MLEFGNKEFRNLQEQVGKNMDDITSIKQSMGSALPDPIEGPEGPQGPKGDTGDTGERGNSIFGVSHLLPSPTAYKNGDFYLCDNGYIYKKIEGVWVLQCSIKGPQGIQGETGDVVANPDTYTDTITKIEIDGVKYQILDTFSRELQDFLEVDNNKLEMKFNSIYDDDGTTTLQDYIHNNSTEVSSNPSNGYINVDDVPLQVYDDTNIREILEGKNQVFVVSDSLTLNDIKALVATDTHFYDIQGNDISTDIANGDYDGITLSMSAFAVQTDNVTLSGYIAYILGGKFYLDTVHNFEHNVIKIGDIVIVEETNVPDRWYEPAQHYYKLLETAKLDPSYGAWTLEGNAYTLSFKSGGTAIYNMEAGRFFPSLSNTRQLGDTNFAFKDVYTNKINGQDIANKDLVISDSIATNYNNTATYSVGAIVMYNGQLYKCSTAVNTPEDFDDSKWTAVNIDSELGSINSALSPFVGNLPVYVIPASPNNSSNIATTDVDKLRNGICYITNFQHRARLVTFPGSIQGAGFLRNGFAIWDNGNTQCQMGKYQANPSNGHIDLIKMFEVSIGSNKATLQDLSVSNSVSGSAFNAFTKNIPECPTTTDGTYALKATVSSGAVTYSWVAE